MTFSDLLKAKAAANLKGRSAGGADDPGSDLEGRIRGLEDALDEYVKGIGLVSSSSIKGVEMVIEDTRKPP